MDSNQIVPVGGVMPTPVVAHGPIVPIGAAMDAPPVDQSGDIVLDNIKRLAQFLPSVGGAIGGMVGGIPGAAIGGGAGEGYKQLGQHAAEFPAAIMDVLRNLVAQPKATISGFVGGGLQGQDNAAIEAGKQGAMQTAGAAVSAATKPAGTWLMQKAIKPTVALLNEYRTTGPELAQTLLKEGVSVTPGGLEKLQQLFSDNNATIRAAVQNAPGTIEKPIVAARALTTAGKLAQQTNPEAALAALKETVQGFLNHPIYTGQLTVPEAQAMKVGTYKAIGDNYGELSNAATETQKALARGLKEEVAANVPGIAAMNARDSQLMAAMDAVGRRVAQAGNMDPVGFAWAAIHKPAGFVAALIDRNPAVKSLIARGLWDEAGRVAGVTPTLIRTAVAAIASGASDATPDTTPDSAAAPASASSGGGGRR